METLRDLGGESKKANDQMKDDLDKLQTEHAGLKARIAQLEARAGERDTGKSGAAKKAKPARVPAKRRKR
jgi:cell division protein FtsB